MNNLLITAFQNCDENFLPVLDIVFDNNKQYFDKYHIRILKKIGKFVPDHITGEHAKSWEKTYIINSLFYEEPNVEWFFALDADAIIVNHGIDLRIFPFLSPKDRDFIVCSTYQDMKTIYWNFNAGIYFVKNTLYMRELYKKMINMVEETNGSYNDQLSWQRALSINFDGLLNKTTIYPRTAFNHESNFIYHPCEETFGLNQLDMLEMKKTILRNKLQSVKS